MKIDKRGMQLAKDNVGQAPVANSCKWVVVCGAQHKMGSPAFWLGLLWWSPFAWSVTITDLFFFFEGYRSFLSVFVSFIYLLYCQMNIWSEITKYALERNN